MSGKKLTKAHNISDSVLVSLAGVSVVFLLAEFAFEGHPHVKYEAWFGFYSVAAFAATALLAFVCKLLRGLLQRDRGYYDG